MTMSSATIMEASSINDESEVCLIFVPKGEPGPDVAVVGEGGFDWEPSERCCSSAARASSTTSWTAGNAPEEDEERRPMERSDRVIESEAVLA